MSDYLDVDALWRVGLFAGAFAVGIVMLYSIGIVAMARGSGAGSARGRLAGRVVWLLCLLMCVAAVAFGIWTMLDK